jgi:hypothetical protein
MARAGSSENLLEIAAFACPMGRVARAGDTFWGLIAGSLGRVISSAGLIDAQ